MQSALMLIIIHWSKMGNWRSLDPPSPTPTHSQCKVIGPSNPNYADELLQDLGLQGSKNTALEAGRGRSLCTHSQKGRSLCAPLPHDGEGRVEDAKVKDYMLP